MLERVRPSCGAPAALRVPWSDDGAVLRWLSCWLLLGLAVRLAVSWASGAGLHVDEAQYAWWSRDLQWGYYSKPPVIAALIRASTELFGDDPLGVRWLPMLCWTGAAGLVYRLGRDVAGRGAGLWAAAIFVASPLHLLGGLAATTDAPLMLSWALAMSLAWRAVHWDHGPYWCVWAVAIALGVLSKPTMLALLPATAWWAWRMQGRQGLWHVCLAALAAAVLVSPWLGWNHLHGWPTWQHLRDSTDAATGTSSTAAERVLILVVGQGLLLGPVAWFLWWRERHRLSAWHAVPRPRRRAASAALRAVTLTLLIVGVLQAIRGRIELNWLAPLHLAWAVWLGCRLAPAPGHDATVATGRHSAVAPLLLAQAACVVALCLCPTLWQFWRPGDHPPAALDPWARMRGWREGFARLDRYPQAWPGAVLTSDSRSVLMQGAYAWRRHGIVPAGFSQEGQIRHHADLVCPWSSASRSGRVVILVDDRPPTAADRQRLGTILAQDHVRVPRSRDRSIDLYLLAGRPEPAIPPTQKVCP